MFKKVKSFLFSNHTPRQTVTKNVFWYTFSNIVGRLTRAGLIIVVARVLGTEGYGTFSYALSLAAFFTIFSDAGISPILTREVAKHPEKVKEYLSTSLGLKIVLLAATIIVTLTVAPSFTNIEAAKPLIPIMAFLLTFDSMQNFAFALARAYNRTEIEAILYVVTNFFIVIFSIVALIYSPTSIALSIAYTAGSGLGCVAVYWILRHEFANIISHFSRRLIKPIITAAWPFALMGLLGNIMINTDTIMLGYFRNASEVGIYSAAQRPVQLIYLIPGILATSSFPLIARFVREKQSERLRLITQKLVASSLMVGLPLFVGGFIVATPLMSALFGAEYAPATASFQILLATVVFYFPGVILGNIIFAHDKQKVFIVSTLLGAVGNFIFDLVFIPKYGATGSSVATLIAQLLSNGYLWAQTRKLEPFSITSNLTRIIPATLIMGLGTTLLYLAHINPIAIVAISSLLYTLLLLGLKEPLLKEVRTSLQQGVSVEQEVRG